jgi:hypothetical protein
MAALDDEVRRLKQKQKDELKEFELNKARDMARLKDDFEITEKESKVRLKPDDSDEKTWRKIMDKLKNNDNN